MRIGKRFGIALATVVLLIVGTGLVLLKPPPKPVPAPPITLGYGTIQGMREGDVTVYRGIAYAAPPIGDLRWRPPQPPAKIDGVFVADHFKPVCPQIGEPLEGLGPEPMDEDCLGLNIWAPAKAANEKLPVMVFLPGGGYVKGGGSSRLYWGGPLAQEGVVLVTVNYRIGALGLLAHPDLSRESPDHVSGNYALLDAIAALRWVQANIPAFGGDPGNVTLMGHSAGAYMASDLMTMPLAKGLFRRVIGMSGGDVGEGQMPALPEAERKGMLFQQALGADSLEAMRRIPAAEIVSKGVAMIDEEHKDYGPNRPAIDGDVLPRDAHSAMADGAGSDIGLMVGCTTQEDADVLWRCKDWAELHARTGAATWAYRFSQVPPWQKTADHGAELPYVFGYPGNRVFFVMEAPWKAWRDARLATTMRHAWTSFAKTGDPGQVDAAGFELSRSSRPRSPLS